MQASRIIIFMFQISLQILLMEILNKRVLIQDRNNMHYYALNKILKLEILKTGILGALIKQKRSKY